MSGIAESWHALSTAVADRGLTATATCREHYLQSASEDQSVWVTELQQPVIRP
jgi:effector-binding domain-containing protein